MEQRTKKRYKLRPGVVLVEICGEYLLVATGEARGCCPYVTQINRAAAEYWRVFEQESELHAIVNRLCERSGKEKKSVLLPLYMFIQKMAKSGYLIEEEDV